MRHKFTTEERRRGGKNLVEKLGEEYMRQIGSKGFWATMESLAQRQNIPVDYPGNPMRNLLRNLMAAKANGHH